MAFVDQGYTGAAAEQGIRLEMVTLPEAKRGVGLLPKHGVVERPQARLARFRRLACNHELLPETLGGVHLGICDHLVAPLGGPHDRKCITAASPA